MRLPAGPPDDPGGLVRRFGARLAPGSYLVLSHGTPEERPDDADTVGQLYKGTSNPLSLRSRAEIQALFGDFALVEPGLTWVSGWHPVPGQVDEPERREMLAGVGRRP